MEKVKLPYTHPFFLAADYRMERKKIFGLPIGPKREISTVRECDVFSDGTGPKDIMVWCGDPEKCTEYAIPQYVFFSKCAAYIPDRYFHEHIRDFGSFATHGHEFSDSEKYLMFMSHKEHMETLESDPATTKIFNAARNWSILKEMCGL